MAKHCLDCCPVSSCSLFSQFECQTIFFWLKSVTSWSLVSTVRLPGNQCRDHILIASHWLDRQQRGRELRPNSKKKTNLHISQKCSTIFWKSAFVPFTELTPGRTRLRGHRLSALLFARFGDKKRGRLLAWGSVSDAVMPVKIREE